MNTFTRLLLATSLLVSPVLHAIPTDIERFEQMLVRNPGTGRAFEEVFLQFASESDGLSTLRDRWRAARDAEPSRAGNFELLLGLLAQREGDPERARTHFEAATAEQPEDFRSWRLLARAELSFGNLQGAIEALQETVERPASPGEIHEAYTTLAHAQQRNFDSEGALETLNRLLEVMPNDRFVMEEVADLLLDLEKYDEARSVLGDLQNLATGDPQREIQVQIRLGQISVREDDREGALERFGEALQRTHSESWLYRDLRNRIEDLFRRDGDLHGLIDYYERQVEERPNDLATMARLADLFDEVRDPDTALVWRERRAEAAPDDNDAQYALASGLLKANRFEEAEPILARLVRINPSRWEFRESWGESFWQAYQDGNDEAFEKAVETWEGLLPDEPTVAEILRLAEVYEQRDLEGKADAAFELAIENEPDAYDLRERFARFLFDTDREERAWTVLRNAGNPLPSANAYLRLARLEERRDQPEKALESVRAGLALEPDRHDLLDLEWQVLARLENWAAAADLFPRLLAAAPNEFAIETIERRQLMALSSSGQFDDWFEAAQARLEAGTLDDEAEFRLFARAVLNEPRLFPAEAVFTYGHEHFPDSFLIAQLEAEHLSRTGEPGEQVAAIRRLMELRPARKSEFLRRIVAVHKQHHVFDAGRDATQELLDLAPNDPDHLIFAAEFEYEAGEWEAGNEALYRAIRVASEPGQIRLRLAAALVEQGNLAQGLGRYEEAFAAEEDLDRRLAIVEPMATAAVQANDLDGLLRRIQTRYRHLRDTGDLDLIVGQIHFVTDDFTRAREAWENASRQREFDPNLLQRMIQLAAEEGRTDEELRYVRLLNERQPTSRNALRLAEAQMNNHDHEEALTTLRPHLEDLLQDTRLLRGFLHSFQRSDFLAEFIDTIQNAPGVDSPRWERDLLVSEILIANGKYREAASLLWPLFERPEPETEAAQAKATSAPIPGVYPGASPDSMMLHRARQAYRQLQQTVMEGRQRHQGNLHYQRPNPFQPASSREAAVVALVYLGMIAVTENREEAFLTQVETALHNKRASHSDRLLAYLALEAAEPLEETVREALAAGFYDEGLYGMAVSLLSTATSPAIRTAYSWSFHPLLNETDNETLERLVERIIDENGSLALQFQIMNFLEDPEALPEEEIQDLLDQVRTQLEDDVRHAWGAHMLIPALFDGGYRSEARSLLKLMAESQVQGFSGFHVATGMLTMGSIDTFDDADWEMVMDSILQAPIGSARSGAGSFPLNQLLGGFVPIDSFSPNDHHQLQSIASTLMAADALDNFRQRLENASREREIDATRADRLQFYFALFANDVESATEIADKLLEDAADDSIRYNLGKLLMAEERFEEAVPHFQSVQARRGNLFTAVQIQTINAAMETDEQDTARMAASRLLKQTLPSYLPGIDLPTILEELGMTEEREVFRKRQSQPRNQHPHRRNQDRLAEVRRLIQDDELEAADRLARSILREVRFSEIESNLAYHRNQVRDMMLRAGLLDGFVDDIEEQLAFTPDSLQLNFLAAEALMGAGEREDMEEALVRIEHLVELRPQNKYFRGLLVQQLARLNRHDDIIKILGKESGDDLFFALSNGPTREPLLNAYRESGRVDELVDSLLESSIFSKNTATLHGGPHIINLGMNLLRGLNPQNEPEAIIRLGETFSPSQPHFFWQIQSHLIKAYEQLNRTDFQTALSVVERLFPDPQATNSADVLFVGQLSSFQQPRFPWYLTHNTRNSRPHIPAVQFVEEIESPELLANLSRALQQLADQRGDPHLEMKALGFLIRVRLYDRAAVDELPALLTSIKEALAQDYPGLARHLPPIEAGALLFFEELLGWGGDAPEMLAPLLEEYAATLSNRASGITANQDLGSTPLLRRAAAILAASEGERDRAAELIDLNKDHLIRDVRRNPGGPQGEMFFLQNFFDLLDLGKSTDALEIIDVLRAQSRGQPGFRQASSGLDEVAKLFEGQLLPPMLAVWPDEGDMQDEDGLTVHWEIGGQSESSDQEPQQEQSRLGTELSQYTGRFGLKIELLGTSGGEILETIRIERATATGTTHFATTPRHGVIAARLLPPPNNDQAAGEGQPETASPLVKTEVPFARTTNLLPNPEFQIDFEAEDLSDRLAGWSRLKRMPFPSLAETWNGRPVHVFNHLPHARGNEAVSTLIPCDPEQEYLFTGWFRQLGRGHNDIRVEAIAKDGETVLQQERIYFHFPSSTIPAWIHRYVRILPSGRRERNALTLPEETRFLRLKIGSNLNLELNGLNLQKLEAPETEMTERNAGAAN